MLYWLQSMDWIQCCCCGWSTMEMGFVDRPFVFPASLHSFSSSSPSLQSPSLTIIVTIVVIVVIIVIVVILVILVIVVILVILVTRVGVGS